MESDKRTRSGSSSSEESDQVAGLVEIQDGVSSTTNNKRSYECTYCKRGFTNAQALGGHMNIHRKDRAKVKQHPISPNNNLSRKSEENFGVSVSINNNYASGETCYSTNPGGVEIQRGYAYDLHVPSPASSSPRSNFSFHCYESAGNLPLRRATDGSLLDANLNLGVGSNHSTSTENFEENGEKHGLDLELRLGPDP